MTYLVSISDRGLIYIPKKVQKKMKFKKHMKIELTENEDNSITLKPVKDIMEFAGKAKIKAPKDFDFRKYMEENYERI